MVPVSLRHIALLSLFCGCERGNRKARGSTKETPMIVAFFALTILLVELFLVDFATQGEL